MTTTDTFEIELAKALAGESASMPSHVGFSSSVESINTTDTALTSEIGTRKTLSATRIDNTVTFTGVRLSTDVIDTTNGDVIAQTGIFNTLTQPNGLLAGVPVEGITHTTSFDLEVIADISIIRG